MTRPCRSRVLRTRQGRPARRQDPIKISGAAAITSSAGRVLKSTKRLLVGRPLRNERLGETLLPKKLALPVFCSDPLSSNAYATEEILRALSVGGLALFFLAPW